MKLSIVIPFFNEEATLAELLNQVLTVDLPGVQREIIAIDDGSQDSSKQIADTFASQNPDQVRVLALRTNQGKGAAVITGLRQASGDVLIVQDADLEYDPNDYREILAKYEDDDVKVVFGSRILGEKAQTRDGKRRSYTQYYWGGRLLTLVTNLLYGSSITDEPTCYKSFRRELLEELDLRSTGFEFCPEITAKLLRLGYKIVEVPIQYNPRKFEDGKKIRYSDGIVAIWTLLRLRFARVRKT